MTVGQEILVRRTCGPAGKWCQAQKGDVWYLVIHGVQFSPELRSKWVRVRLLEDQRDPVTRCELVDDFPGAPPEWPLPPKKVG